MNGHEGKYRIKQATISILTVVISICLFGLLLLPAAAVFVAVGVFDSIGAVTAPLPSFATTVSAFVGTALGAGLGLASRVPISRGQTNGTGGGGGEFPGEYRLGLVTISSGDVLRDLRLLLNVLRASALVAIGAGLVEFAPSGLSVSPAVLVTLYALVDELLYSLDHSVRSVSVTSPSGYVYNTAILAVDALDSRGVIHAEEFPVSRLHDSGSLGPVINEVLKPII